MLTNGIFTGGLVTSVCEVGSFQPDRTGFLGGTSAEVRGQALELFLVAKNIHLQVPESEAPIGIFGPNDLGDFQLSVAAFRDGSFHAVLAMKHHRGNFLRGKPSVSLNKVHGSSLILQQACLFYFAEVNGSSLVAEVLVASQTWQFDLGDVLE
jgi:hypothetical protein